MVVRSLVGICCGVLSGDNCFASIGGVLCAGRDLGLNEWPAGRGGSSARVALLQQVVHNSLEGIGGACNIYSAE